ncbi:MAG: DUF1080 domain-containing protein [Phycisphaerales bacterium]|nr:DUF1080 domain-containing protein [Phycisphaerales bacterium]
MLIACLTGLGLAVGTPLFDGQSLEGFTVLGPEAWAVEDGAIVGSSTNLTEQSWLYWPGPVDDFTLTLEFKIDAGNSGINYRARPGGHQGMIGYQADIDVDHVYTGALYDLDGGRAVMTPRGERRRFGFQDNIQDLGPCGDAHALVADITPGTWHTYTVEARGAHLVHRIDGRITSETWDEDPDRRHISGGFAFQVHPGHDCRVAFRNINLVEHDMPEGLHVPDGFTATKLLDAGDGEGSWVSLAFEPDGDILVSPQHGRIRRVDLDAGTTTPIAIDIGSAQGMVHHDGTLYVVVSRNPPEGGLHALRDTNGDGAYDEHENLIEWGNGSEHGPHSIKVGPDGNLWVIQGNHTPLPPGVDLETSPFRGWAEDLVTERAWDANGHAVGVESPGGVVWRFNPATTPPQIELIAGGQRNACDFAFTPDGECFAWDSDMEWDMGMPWYRLPRIVHVLPGSDNGWRSGTGKWKPWYPDAVAPVCGTPPGSPTALVHAGDGAFGLDWEGVLLAADWSYGRIWAVTPRSKGASFTATLEPFAQGRPFNVSSMRFGPNGALYLVTGGRGTASALWRIAADEPQWVDPQIEIAPALTTRRHLESQAHRLDAIWLHFGTGDQAMSNAARLALDRVSIVAVRNRALAESDPPTVIDAWTYLATRDGDIDITDVAARLCSAAAQAPELQAKAMRALGLTLVRREAAGAVCDTTGVSPLVAPLLAHDEHDARFEAAAILTRLGTVDPAWLLSQLESAHGTQALDWGTLCRLHSGMWTPEQELHFVRWLRRHREVIGGRSARNFIAQFERRFLEGMTTARAGNLVAQLETEQPPEPLSEPGPMVEHWTMNVLNVAMSNADPESHGSALFRKARCVECHRFRGYGGSSGPDLTGVGGRFSEEDLLRAIVEPDRDMSDQYAATWVETEDGLYTGRLLDLDDDRVVLDVDPYEPVHAVSINRDDILVMEPSDVSTMPPGLLNTLRPGEIRTLLNWLRQP